MRSKFCPGYGVTEAPPVTAAPSTLQVEGGKETILLVDDERAIRDMVALGLQSYGYRVIEAASGEEALRIWADHAGEIALLFTDMRMPGGMTGMELFERLKRTKATLKGIVSSGYSDEILEGQEVISQWMTFLPKPYDLKTLAGTVRSCLNRVPASPVGPAGLTAPSAPLPV